MHLGGDCTCALALPACISWGVGEHALCFLCWYFCLDCRVHDPAVLRRGMTPVSLVGWCVLMACCSQQCPPVLPDLPCCLRVDTTPHHNSRTNRQHTFGSLSAGVVGVAAASLDAAHLVWRGIAAELSCHKLVLSVYYLGMTSGL